MSANRPFSFSETDRARLDELRRTITRMQVPATVLDGPGDCPLGVPEIDRALGGGLARGALHEIAAQSEAHVAATTGFALGVAIASLFWDPSKVRDPGIHNPDREYGFRARAFGAPRNDSRKIIVWVIEDMGLVESGALYGPGLDDYGLAPERLLTVAVAKADDVLWVMEEALHCRAVGMVIGEVRQVSRERDLVATRRLSLAAATHGALALLLRSRPHDEASAVATRWVVGASPSPGGKAKGLIGPPRFDVALMRNRRGPLGSWMLEWSIVDASFVLATHSESLARTAADRSPAQAA